MAPLNSNKSFDTLSTKTASSLCSSPNTSAHDDHDCMRIRVRYLQKLGVANFHKDPANAKVRRKRTNSFVEPLKAEADDEDITVQSPPISSSPTAEVSFESRVIVHPIPSHIAYSNRIRNALWTDSEQMKQEMKRNCIEFIAEGWDWKKVVEEDEFFVWDDELVHPVHAMRATNVKDRFLMVMKEQSHAI
eukprot:scaffold1529_cov86-Cylindrotheca_fusiformis.AAC.13